MREIILEQIRSKSDTLTPVRYFYNNTPTDKLVKIYYEMIPIGEIRMKGTEPILFSSVSLLSEDERKKLALSASGMWKDIDDKELEDRKRISTEAFWNRINNLYSDANENHTF